MLYAITNDIVLSLILSAALAWFILMLTDFNAQPGYCADLGFEGLSFYQGGTAIWGPVAHYIAKVLDKVGLKEAKFTPEYIQEKLGVVGEPAVLGSIMVCLWHRRGFFWVDIVMLMIALATSLILIPMMSGIVMQAMVPVSEAAATFMKKSSGGRQLFIGVDPAIAVGNTTVLATTVLMVRSCSYRLVLRAL